MDSADAAAIAQSTLRRFARLTNLGLAATPVAILGEGPVAEELARILDRIGAQLVEIDEQVPPQVQLLILAAVGVAVPPVTPADRPLLLVDVGCRPDREWFTALPSIPSRPGIDGRRGHRDLFWLEFTP